jgi:hypothetical protein
VNMYAVGDRVTVNPAPTDPIEICEHRHALVTDVDGDVYTVGHPHTSDRRYGPYPAQRLTPGWGIPD